METDYKMLLKNSLLRQVNFHYSPKVEQYDNIAYGIDENYARCLTVSIISICYNNPARHLSFHIITNQLSDKNLVKLEEVAKQYKVNISCYFINDESFRKFSVKEYLPLATYFRLMLPALYETGRYLYIDADVICMGDISGLLDFELADNMALVVHDYALVAEKRERALGLAGNTYFNAGVVVFNLEKWSGNNMIEKIIKILLNPPVKLEYLDQDVLNIVLAGHVQYLDNAYNRINVSREADYKKKIAATRLMHFTAHPKPWTILWNYCGDEALKGIYEKYEAISPWKDEPLELPKYYKHKKWYSSALWNEGRYREAVYWFYQYLQTKFKSKRR